MTDKLKTTGRIAAVGLAMLYGSVVFAPATAAQETEDPVAVAEEDEGTDWGWLGLLGLAGLAGLIRRPKPVVHERQGTAARR